MRCSTAPPPQWKNCQFFNSFAIRQREIIIEKNTHLNGIQFCALSIRKRKNCDIFATQLARVLSMKLFHFIRIKPKKRGIKWESYINRQYKLHFFRFFSGKHSIKTKKKKVNCFSSPKTNEISIEFGFIYKRSHIQHTRIHHSNHSIHEITNF